MAGKKAAAPKGAAKTGHEELLATLKARFEKHKARHAGIEWAEVESRLAGDGRALRSLAEMERTGGEPDVIGRDEKSGELLICDCSAESPEGRRSVCYDARGQAKREKEGITMAGNMLEMAAAMGIEPLTEEQYRELQRLGEFDTKSQSWLKAPEEVTRLGGAIFGDRRFGRVFVYHNTPPSFYRARGFRGLLRV